MDFYKVINSRRTTRDFQPFDVSEKTVESIITAGLKAPTNDHLKDWHFIIVKDRDVVAKLLELIPKSFSDKDMDNLIKDWNLSDKCQQEMYRNAVPKQNRMLSEASFIIVPLLKQKVDILKPESLSYLNGFASIWCCIENIFLASVAEGLGCNLRIPLGNEGEWTRKILGYPEEYIMPCFIGVGKPAENIKYPKQKEIDIKSRIHNNVW